MPTQEDLTNKEWRVNNLYKIRNKHNRIIKFERNAAQRHYNANKHNRNIILKSRQLGFTTDETIDMLDDCLWTPGFEALLISYDQPSSLDLFDKKIEFAWQNYPEQLRNLYTLDADRANKLKFGYGDGSFSEIQVRTKARSGTYSRIHISEFGKICAESARKAEEIVTGTIPSVPTQGRIDIESTAEGESGAFYDMFWEAWDRGEPNSPLEFKAHFYNWTWDKEEIDSVPLLENLPEAFGDYQRKFNLSDKEISYYYQKFLSLGKSWRRLHQEYPTTPEEAFSSSGAKLIDQEAIEWQNKWILEGEKIGDWTYYLPYKANHSYALGADVAEGVGQDSSTAVVLDFKTGDVVATYKSNQIAPDIFAHELKNGANRYGSCLIAVERNNHGFATLTTLKAIYDDIYAEHRPVGYTDEETKKLGWHTNARTKPMMMFEVAEAIHESLIKLHDKSLISEARTYDKGDLGVIRFDEDQTKHWDLLIALAIAWQMRDQVGSDYEEPSEREVIDRYALI